MLQLTMADYQYGLSNIQDNHILHQVIAKRRTVCDSITDELPSECCSTKLFGFSLGVFFFIVLTLSRCQRNGIIESMVCWKSWAYLRGDAFECYFFVMTCGYFIYSGRNDRSNGVFIDDTQGYKSDLGVRCFSPAFVSAVNLYSLSYTIDVEFLILFKMI